MNLNELLLKLMHMNESRGEMMINEQQWEIESRTRKLECRREDSR